MQSGRHTHANWPISHLAKLINPEEEKNKQFTKNLIKSCMHVAATFVQFACDWRLNSREN